MMQDLTEQGGLYIENMGVIIEKEKLSQHITFWCGVHILTKKLLEGCSRRGWKPLFATLYIHREALSKGLYIQTLSLWLSFCELQGFHSMLKAQKLAISFPSQTMGLWPHQQCTTAEVLAKTHLQFGLGRVGSCCFDFYSNVYILFTQLSL